MKFKYINTRNIELDKLVEYSNYQAKERREYDEEFMILTSETLFRLTLRFGDNKLLHDIFKDTKKYMGGIIHILEDQLFFMNSTSFREMAISDMEENWDCVWEYVESDLLFDLEGCTNAKNTKVV